MALFAIADLHLGFGVSKPMSIFGERWHHHDRIIAENWEKKVGPDDAVLIPGDISWGINLTEALPDLIWLNRLPGTKILLRGNHDYWWTSMTKIKILCAEHELHTLRFLRNDSYEPSPKVLVCGTRGWLLPDDPEFSPDDEKVYLREVGRLRRSLEDAAQRRKPGQKLVAGLHYPPFGHSLKQSPFTELLEAFAVDVCVYGHIHGTAPGNNLPSPSGSVRYLLVAADYLSFDPLCVFCCV